MNNDIGDVYTTINSEFCNEETIDSTSSLLPPTHTSYISRAKDYGRLSDEEVIELSKAKDTGDIRAKNKLIESNLMLVVSIAKQFNKAGIYDEDDLIQDGNLGLIKAVEMFDHTKGIKFSTYATYWIMQSIRRSLSQKYKTIRLPVGRNALYNRIFKFENDFYAENGREATLEEIATHFNLDIETLSQIKLANSTISLSQPIKKPDSTSELGDFIADNNGEQAFEDINYMDFKEALLKSISEILPNKREIFVITKLFGLEDGKKRTLEEVGNMLGVTREFVRQIKVRALKRLRKNPTFRENFENILA